MKQRDERNNMIANDSLLPPVSCHVFIFYNPHSGNRQGEQVKQYAGQFVRLKRDTSFQVNMFDLSDDNNRNKGVNYLSSLMQMDAENKKIKFVICSAGGDGSFVWVISNLMQQGIHVQRHGIYFTVFGFGTGNDLSQSLGWGRFVPYKDTATFDGFAKHIVSRLQGQLSHMDLWQVTIIPNCGTIDRTTSIPHGYIEKATKCHRHQHTGVMTFLMSNYLTLGIQGIVGTGFEQNRRGSRLFNVLEYVRQCFCNGVMKHLERVPEYVSHIENDGNMYTIDVDRRRCRRMVEILFQNLPGIWGRRMKLWDLCKKNPAIVYPRIGGADQKQWTKSAISDGKLDVYGIGSRIDYMFKQLTPYCKRSSLCRIGQFSKEIVIHCVPGSLFHMMLDGEFYVLYNIKEIRLNKTANISILRN